MRSHPSLFRNAVLICLVTVLGAFHLGAQAPMTQEELARLLADAQNTWHAVRSFNLQDSTLQGRARNLVAAFVAHNATPCEYPQGQPELCANYDRERSDLNIESADLQRDLKVSDSSRRVLNRHFAELMVRLRTAAYPGQLASRQAALVACSNVNGVAAAAHCLENLQPPRTAREPGTPLARAMATPAPTTIDLAQREGAEWPATWGPSAQPINSLLGWRGDSLRRCVSYSGIPPARSGEFEAGGDDVLVAVRGDKIYCVPLHPSTTDTLVVRARSLDDSMKTSRFVSGNWAVNSSWFYASGYSLPSSGRWLAVATSGANWGCFIFNVY